MMISNLYIGNGWLFHHFHPFYTGCLGFQVEIWWKGWKGFTSQRLDSRRIRIFFIDPRVGSFIVRTAQQVGVLKQGTFMDFRGPRNLMLFVGGKFGGHPTTRYIPLVGVGIWCSTIGGLWFWKKRWVMVPLFHHEGGHGFFCHWGGDELCYHLSSFDT